MKPREAQAVERLYAVAQRAQAQAPEGEAAELRAMEAAFQADKEDGAEAMDTAAGPSGSAGAGLEADPQLRATGSRLVQRRPLRRGKQGGKLLGVFTPTTRQERRKAKQKAKRAALRKALG